MSEQPVVSSDTDPDPGPPPKADAQTEPHPDKPEDSAEATGADSPDREESEDEAALSAEALAVEVGLRHQMRRAGIESLGDSWFSGPASFGGHAAGRDVNVYYYETTRRTAPETGPVDPEQLRRIEFVHVSGASHTTAAQKLDKERLVVLRGADGSGKRTTALFMLRKLIGDDIHSVSADQILGTQNSCGLTERAGHLATIPGAGELTYSRLAALSAALNRCGSYLVITTPVETMTETDVDDRFVVDHKPPDSRQVILSHLSLDPDDAGAAELLLWESSALACAATPGAAAKLAAHLLDAAREGLRADDLHPVLAEMRRHRVQYLLQIGSLKQARERVEVLYRRAALLSIAVFAGLPHADAMAAAEDLAARFIAIEFYGKRYELFIPWRARLLQEPDIEFSEQELPGPWGPVRVPQVRFTDVELNASVLETVWEEYEATRSPLLDWLRELAVNPRDEAVRVRAAQITGRLAGRDFGHICHRLILDWANSVNAKPRAAAATALSAVPAAMKPHAWRLLKEWCDSGNQHQQRTAVLALGTGIREDKPGEVLGQLRRIALRNTGRTGQTMGNTVRRSVAELFSGEHPAAVVRALSAWTTDSDSRLQVLARQCVLPLAHMTDESEEPILLRIMARDPGAQKDTATAIAAALDETGTRQEMWSALEKLALAVVRHPELTGTLGTLLSDLTQLSGTADEQLRFYLLLWAHRHPGLRQENRVITMEDDYAGR
jgi:hypothetical protein